MNIQELDAYNLDDAVKFNDRLNSRLWAKNEHLRPEVQQRLLEIANDFREFLGIKDLDLADITISGSNAAYTYTPNSDIDLHLVVKMPADEVYRELFDAKKYQYNDQHDITIGGADVELYVQAADQPHISQGIYSILNNEWLQVPRRVKSAVDDTSTRNKFETVGHQIEQAIASGSLKRMTRMIEKIKRMRQTGLEAHGEFGPENLAFKILRTQGKIKELYDARNRAKDQELSLRERKKPGSVFIYGFKHEESVEPMIDEAVEETSRPTDEEILRDFIDFCVKELKIEQMPVIKLRKDPQWSVVHKTFGRYINDQHLLEVAWGHRHIMDVLRTVAHELTHRHQHERDGDRMGPDAGETGSPYENEANARAGVLMRDYARLHPEYFAVGQAQGLHEEVNESLKSSAAAAMAACVIGGGSVAGCATQHGMNPVDAARVVYNAKRNYTGEVLRADVQQELNNFLRAQKGDPNAQNSSQLYQLQRRTQNESASGYIPTKRQANDPRFKMALTKDIRPGQLGKEANKLKLKTDSQGHPQVANPNGLFEKLALEFAKFKKADEDYSPDNPPGPESKPTMPKGTVRVDVSDMYDWYKLGKNISNLKGVDKSQFGKGPPSTIVSFGDEDTEHKYIKDLENLGLTTTDIDPVDPSQPKNMPRQKTDPTYNVAESTEQLDEVRMAPSNLMQWARSPEAEGIRSGFEAEMIFRDTNNNGDDDDQKSMWLI